MQKNVRLPENFPSTQTLPVLNPFDLSIVDSIPQSSQTDIETALNNALSVYQDRSQWPQLFKRLNILERAITIIEERFDELANTATREGGKPYRDSHSEVLQAQECIKSAIAILRTNSGTTIPMGITQETTHRMAFTQKGPIGVVVAYSGFNHPLLNVVQQVIPAIAAGCPVIMLPACETPLSCHLFLNLLLEAGIDPKWAQIVTLSDQNLIQSLVMDPRVSFLTFTGRASTGWKLRSLLASGTRCSLMHSGAAPVIVTGDSDIYEVREALLDGCFYHAGQVSVSVQRIFAHTKIATKLATQLAMKAAGLTVGDPMNADTEIGPLIRPEETARIHDWVIEAVNGGGQLLTGGEKLTDTLYAPTVIFNAPADSRLMTEEVRGPVVCIDPWFDVEDAILRANSLPTAIHAAVFTRDVESAMSITDRLDASAVMINDHTAFWTAWMPFSGLREAGIGTSGIPYAIDELRVDKTIVLRTDSLKMPNDADPT